MDVPYNQSGASSRAHYQIVRNVENMPQQSEQLLLQEVERIKQRVSGRMLSTSELRKDLIVLLYCMNNSFGAVNGTTLAFALPSAVHLAEAGSRASEKRIGYLFCSEAMPREHEMQLMLVNTIRKDLTSASTARINLALECLVNSPTADVVPAVHTRCVELLSHPSPRIRVLAMDAILSLSRLASDLLNDEKIKQMVLKRMSDSDESVVRAALRLSLIMMESRLMEGDEIMRSLLSLVSRISDKHTYRDYSTSFAISILKNIASVFGKDMHILKADHTDELLPNLFAILRRAVKHSQQPMILECFRLLGRFQPTVVVDYIKKLTSQIGREEASDKPQSQFVHPVARIRHFLSSRTVNEHFLFLSCLACLDPSLWAGTQNPTEELFAQPAAEAGANEEGQKAVMPPVLDQWEVERVMSFLESDDDQIRALTLQILTSLDPSLVESCYSRALDALRNLGPSNSSDERIRRVVLHRLLEMAFSVSLGNKILADADMGHIFVEKIREVVDAAGERKNVDPSIVEAVLNRMRKESATIQYACTTGLLSLIGSERPEGPLKGKLVDPTLLLIILALTCESAHLKAEAVSTICTLATILNNSPAAMQEPILVCMSRLASLLFSVELSSTEIEDVKRKVHELGESSAVDKKRALVHRRCEQFLKISADPDAILQSLENNKNISLPEFALLLDQLDVRKSVAAELPKNSPPPSIKLTSPTLSRMDLSSLSQSKLRYDAYAPPSTSFGDRIARAHSHSSTVSGRSSNRPSSRASSTRSGSARPGSRGVSVETDLTQTVTAGELALAVGGGNKFARTPDRKVKEDRRHESEQIIHSVKNDNPSKPASNLIALDSPFLSEPLVDVVDQTPATPPVSSPYVSANTSLRTSPERGPSFEELWSALVANEDTFSARGWYDDASDIAVRRLQSLRLRMEVLPADVAPYEGDLKVSLYSTSLDTHLPCALLRLHEEGDGSCLWQVKCTDAEIGSKVKDLFR